MSPLFSIIIPAFNVEDYVCQAIDSCVNQVDIMPCELEIIVINDGSTDGTQTQLEKYINITNITIVEQLNSGLSETRNKGVKIAKGDYILFLDADDWFKEDALSIIKRHLNEADLIMFPMIYYWDDNKVIYNHVGNLRNHIYSAEELLKGTIGKSEFQACPAPCKCYKSTLFKEQELKFIKGILHEDGPFYLEVLSKVKTISYVDEFFYYYRQKREHSITTAGRTINNAEGVFKGVEHVYNIYGYKNKDVCFYYIAVLTMQLFQKYASEDDAQRVVAYMSKHKTRRLIMNSLLRARFSFRTMLLSFGCIISPSISRRIYTFKHQ